MQGSSAMLVLLVTVVVWCRELANTSLPIEGTISDILQAVAIRHRLIWLHLFNHT